MSAEPTPPTPATPPAPAPVTHPNPNLYPTPDRGGSPPPKSTSGCTKAAMFGCGGVVQTSTLGVGARAAIILTAGQNEGQRKVQAQFSTRDNDAVHVNLGYEGATPP